MDHMYRANTCVTRSIIALSQCSTKHIFSQYAVSTEELLFLLLLTKTLAE